MGPIDKNDVIYQNKLSITEAKRYLDLLMDVQRIGFTSGKTEYGIGVRITTTLNARIFKNSWDLTKKGRVKKGKKFISVKLAELQNSPKAHLVVVIAGSTEGMEMASINNNLAKVLGIEGIGVSY
jgi:Fe-S oxidoreductase